ncbi:hypothetical protein BV22DRAFT_1134794 [Leucogyrophana mollusca]|uniref:Uncharacterized protein n=1 Tax=Leucogyrophana mollusca TaxID=85980 RepID=A0ACB8AXP4_9AGAM|nr:hypothetical protein BV22DRAFT_1134794 [Leucogyrophana mollusca]
MSPHVINTAHVTAFYDFDEVPKSTFLSISTTALLKTPTIAHSRPSTLAHMNCLHKHRIHELEQEHKIKAGGVQRQRWEFYTPSYTTLKLVSRGSTHGIPFAQPPTGQLQFQLLLPTPAYNVSFSATAFGPWAAACVRRRCGGGRDRWGRDGAGRGKREHFGACFVFVACGVWVWSDIAGHEQKQTVLQSAFDYRAYNLGVYGVDLPMIKPVGSGRLAPNMVDECVNVRVTGTSPRKIDQ